MADRANEIPSSDLQARERAARRAVARRERRHRRRRAGAAGVVAILIAVVVLVVALGDSHNRSPTGGTGTQSSRTQPKKKVVVPGGPLAPAAFGGLAALWAPQNVVGAQPGTAAAYSAASTRPGLPGYLMIADRGNNRILVVDPQKRIVFRYPEPGDHGKLFYDDDTFIEPGGASIISNEEDNHAIVQVNLADRSQTVLFGHPGLSGADSTHVKEPDDAYMLPDGTFTVADAANCRILFVRGHAIVRSYGHAAICRHDPPRYFNQVNGDTPVPGGGVMVSEIEGNWIDEIGPEGRLLWSIRAPVSYPSDPQPLPGGRILVADYASPGHALIMNRRGRILWRFGRPEGRRKMDHPSLAMPLPNGDVAVNDDYRHRVIIVNPRTNRIVWQYGHTDQPGTSAGYLNTPDGMDFIPAAADGSPDYAAVVHP
ncbi:MAG TPA: hypothetical protein VGN08_03115 [Solirubrobacteraceae bacterium]|jgi:hypothetical protein